MSGDVCSTLFGSTSIFNPYFGTGKSMCNIVCISCNIICGFFIIRYSVVTFDESFAKATGMKTDCYNLLIAVITAVIIVLAMNLVGSLLISALIIFPALSAMRIFKSVFICNNLFRGIVCRMCSSGIVIVYSGRNTGRVYDCSDRYGGIWCTLASIGKLTGR